jgi:hypothetical protein
MQFLLRKVAADLKVKFKWTGSFPWIIAEADSPEVCQMCLDQLAEADDASLSP